MYINIGIFGKAKGKNRIFFSTLMRTFLLCFLLSGCASLSKAPVDKKTSNIENWIQCADCTTDNIRNLSQLESASLDRLGEIIMSGEHYSAIERSRAIIAVGRIGGERAEEILEVARAEDIDEQVTRTADNALQALRNEILVVLVGDSVASGQGNPDVPGSPPTWQEPECYRSTKSGFVRAIYELESSFPPTQVRLINLSCSGATTRRVIRQLEDAAEILDGEVPDKIIMSVGGNDIEFGNIVAACAAVEYCFAPRASIAGELDDLLAPVYNVSQSIHELREAYSNLGQRIRELFPSLPSSNVFITEYFDPTHAFPNDAMASRDLNWSDWESDPAPNTYCRQLKRARYLAERQAAIEIPPEAGISDFTYTLLTALLSVHPSIDFDGMSALESWQAFEKIVVPLNKEIGRSAEANGWTYVGGIADAFYYHGSCSSSSYIVRGTDSLRDQGNIYGTMHPNIYGHDVYMRYLVSCIRDGHCIPPRYEDVPRCPEGMEFCFISSNGQLVCAENKESCPRNPEGGCATGQICCPGWVGIDGCEMCVTDPRVCNSIDPK